VRKRMRTKMSTMMLPSQPNGLLVGSKNDQFSFCKESYQIRALLQRRKMIALSSQPGERNSSLLKTKLSFWSSEALSLANFIIYFVSDVLHSPF